MKSPPGLLQLLLARLERISADSHWAHQASGVRGALLRAIERPAELGAAERSDLDSLMDLGFRILARAAEDEAR